ncbi:MAG: Gfo/Idh/MocA family protein, partial [Gemmatimonadales bacterium]
MRELPGVRLAGVHDVDGVRAARVSAELDTPAHPDLDGLLEAIDALIVAVPTRSHFEVGRRAIERGCDLLIEKPITTSTAEADELISLGAQHGRVIQVGHIERFNSAVRACDSYLENPLFVESHRLAPFEGRGTDVTVVLDLMIHDIDLILSLVRRPVLEVRAVGVAVLSGRVDIANARLEFEGGAVANITASR